MRETKQLVPELRFSKFQEAWKSKGFEDLFTIGSGKDYKHLNDGNIPVYGTGGYMLSVDDYLHEGKSVCIGRKGTIDKPMYLDEKFWTVDTLFYTHSFEKNISIKFIYYNFLNINWKKYNEASGVPSLSKSTLYKIKINIPSLPEQQKIADFLSQVDKKIDLLSQKLNHLEQYKKGVMQKLFSQEVRFKKDDGSDFLDWELQKGNKVFVSISNKEHNSDLPILAVTQDQGAIPRDMINYNIGVTPKSLNSYKVVEKGDFIISLRSFQGGIEYSNYRGICSPAYIILRSRKEIIKEFFKFYFKTQNYITELNKKLEGIRDGKMISYKYFSEIDLPLPSIQEQNKIANYLSAIDQKISFTQQQFERTQMFKKGLLQKMFV